MPAELQLRLAVAVGQQAKVADALKAGRQRMLQEAAYELLGGDRRHLLFIRMPVVFPAKRNLAVLERQETLVGDGDTMGVQQTRWTTR